MPYRPSGILIYILGVNVSDKGRSCEEHARCGSVLRVDTLVWFRSVQIGCNGQEETALAVYWIMDGKEAHLTSRLHIMENWLKLLNLLQIQTALLIGPNCTSVMACAKLFWLRQRWRKMKKMFLQALMMRTMMEINHNKKDNQTYHTPKKRGTPTRKKRKISSI